MYISQNFYLEVKHFTTVGKNITFSVTLSPLWRRDENYYSATIWQVLHTCTGTPWNVRERSNFIGLLLFTYILPEN
jgi:hypothetical protein